jgi:hypothetical protein
MAVLMGYLNSNDLKDRRVSDIPVAETDEAIRLTLAEYNRVTNLMLDFFSSPTTNVQERFKTPTNARLQPVDENGRALPVKGISQYTVGYPLQMGAHAYGFNYVTRNRITVNELGQEQITAQIADNNFVADHILAALFYVNTSSPAPWTWPDEIHGDISVYGLADGDTVTYQRRNGIAMATDDHVLGFTSITTANLTTIANELKEHPENTGQVIAMVPTASRATIEALTEFVPVSDPNLNYGTVTTTLRNLGVSVPGEIFGYVEGAGIFVSEWPRVPDNYIIAKMTGGVAPLRRREDPNPALRGYNTVADRDDYPWYERQFLRMIGFGAYNRVGAVVATTNTGTYAIPTGYSSPHA